MLREENGRGGSRFVHDDLAEGDFLEIGAPRNNFAFAPPPGSRAVRFVAGGIGITPLIPMLREASLRGLEWELAYGGRSRASMAFVSEIDDPRVHLYPADEVGMIDLDAALGEPSADTIIYACGPGPLLHALQERCAAWPPEALRLERFSAPGEVEREQAEAPFEVVARRSDIVVPVPAGTTVLAALEAAGVPAESSCAEGICGTCEVAVVEGVPDHRDHVLSDSEKARNDCMMICVSRSHSARLVLDI